MTRVHRALRSPLGIGVGAVLVVYTGFLLWPGSDWAWRLGGAVDWVGGALVIVGPLIAGTVCELTLAARRDVTARIPADERQPRGARVILGASFGAFAAAHLLVLMGALAVAWSHGARDLWLLPFGLRHLAAIAAAAALGYVVGLVAPGRYTPALVTVGAFSVWSALMATGLGFFVLTGGEPLISSWHRVNWAHVAPQTALWLALALVALAVDLRTRRLTRAGQVFALAATLVLAWSLPGALGRDFTAVYTAPSARVDCTQHDAITLCLAPGSQKWSATVVPLADLMYSTLTDLGVDTPDTVVEVGPSVSQAYRVTPGDLDSGHAISLGSAAVHGTVPLQLVDELLLDARCASEAAFPADEALAWLYAQLGDDVYPDLTQAVNQAPDGRAWLADVFTRTLTCDSEPAPELPQ